MSAVYVCTRLACNWVVYIKAIYLQIERCLYEQHHASGWLARILIGDAFSEIHSVTVRIIRSPPNHPIRHHPHPRDSPSHRLSTGTMREMIKEVATKDSVHVRARLFPGIFLSHLQLTPFLKDAKPEVSRGS